jgi:hypothetical protein
MALEGGVYACELLVPQVQIALQPAELPPAPCEGGGYPPLERGLAKRIMSLPPSCDIACPASGQKNGEKGGRGFSLGTFQEFRERHNSFSFPPYRS